MPKQKASATVQVADGAGGRRAVSDLRFDEGEWPIRLVIPSDSAEEWMAHLDAEIEERGWSSSSLSQLDRLESSGTIEVQTARGPVVPTLTIVWERLRGGELSVRARPGHEPQLPLEIAKGLIETVLARQSERRLSRAHRRDLFTYTGLPWRGELWLAEDLRLGPPSRFPVALIGPQIVIVDAMSEGIGWRGVAANFEKLLSELRVFLGFVLGTYFDRVRTADAWVPDVAADGRITDLSLRPVGYVELGGTPTFPRPGDARPVERREVHRPDLGPMGYWPDMNEKWVPNDIEGLWDSFRRLSAGARDQLLRAGNAFRISLALRDQRTASATFLVVACETLKPAGRQHAKDNIYDVVRMILGDDEAQRLEGMAHPPQTLRNKHLHRGELAAGELVPMIMGDYFADPSFDDMINELYRTTRTCLVEWMRQADEGQAS